MLDNLIGEYAKTPQELIIEATPWVLDIIERTDPEGQLTELQGVTVAMTAMRKAAQKFDPERGSWKSLALSRMSSALQEALRDKKFLHRDELLLEAVYAATEKAQECGDSDA